ncbi:MAG: Competence protein phosphoribosyltransferase domain protein [Labilithrix sp.]|nr:Competence protein phosphoribosyltransferase domain protein [Labilithrix sp.]
MARDPFALGMLSRIANVGLELLGELVAPTRCAACDEPTGARVLFCATCGVSVMPALAQPAASYAVFDYGGAVATAIVRLKYAGRFDLAARFAGVMAGTAALLADQVDLVVPVPLHPKRLVERGFDQAALLAAPVARRLGIEHAPRALVRTRPTPPQASLDRAARSANVADAFRCASARAVERRRVLLVDDVRTTGATLASCAEALLDAGAREVCSLVLASRDRPGKVQKSAGYED